MAFLMLNQATAIGASLPVKSSRRTHAHMVEVILESTTTTKISACTVKLQGGTEKSSTCVSTYANLGIGSTAQNVKNTDAFYYMINGTNYTIAAGAGGTVITNPAGTAIVGTITGSKYGVFNVYANTAGALVCTVPQNAVSFVQAYDDAATALAAAKLVATPSGTCLIGRCVITAAGGGFTYGTTALTSVVTWYNEYGPYYDIEAFALSGGEITAQRAIFMSTGDASNTSGKFTDYIRVYLSALTGTGYVTVKYDPLD